MSRPPGTSLASDSPGARGVVPIENRRVRLLLIGCAIVAVIVGALGQVVMPARGSPLLAWIDTALIPAIISILIILNRRDRVRIFAIVCGLLYLEALLTAALFAVGMAFAIVVPIIGIGLIDPYVRGRGLLAAYVGAEAAATIGVGLVVFGVPQNPLGTDQPLLTVIAFGLISAAALGLMWRASQRLHEALDASSREIASRTALEIELARTAQLLQALIISSPVATGALDLDGVVTVWNPAAERMFGWRAGEIVGAPLPPDITDDTQGRFHGMLERVLAGETIQGERMPARTKDGREILVDVHVAARRDERGQPAGLIAQAIDVTERSTLEAQLAQAQKMEAVGQLAGGIAHDINNTLTAVGGFAEIIEASTDDTVIQDDARTISDAVGRARQLTRQLLAFARRSVLQPQAIEVTGLVASIRPMFGRLLGADIDLVIRDESGPAWINVDPGQFEQALLNLVVNARDAITGGGTVTITTGRREPPRAGSDEATHAERPSTAAAGGDADSGSEPGIPERSSLGDLPERSSVQRASAPRAAEVTVTVSDTGTGIPAELQGQVFEPFFTTKERGRGSGLGLAMVYGFVTQSGGTVSLTSVPGSGTTFEIRLPEVEPAERAFGDKRAPRPSGSETILLIEDDPAVAQVGRQILRGHGYEVLVASDGAAAIELAGSHQGTIDLILSDVIMPGMSGPEAVEAVLAIRPDAAVAYVSGYTADAIAHRGVLPHGVELIEKPFTSAELGARVRAVLDERAARDDSGAG